MAATTMTTAKIKFLEPSTGGQEKPVSGLKDVEFPYNPKEYSITRSAEWKTPQAKSGALPEYGGPKPAQISVEVFLDATDSPTGDITGTVDTFLQACNPSLGKTFKSLPSAPFVKFIWGTKIAFMGYIESVAVKYSLFRHDGTPIRGTATLTIKEIRPPAAGTNPTSGGVPGTTQHHVIAGDTLASVAYNEYGAAARWRTIADANPTIDDPMRLKPGTSLLVPPS
jgi:nucleoid-associated protein YgaU